MAEASLELLQKEGIKVEGVDWFLPHQANLRIIDSVRYRLGIPTSKVLLTIQKTGNISSASIPVTLGEALREGVVKGGDLILLTAFGAGFTWGAGLLRYPQRSSILKEEK